MKKIIILVMILMLSLPLFSFATVFVDITDSIPCEIKTDRITVGVLPIKDSHFFDDFKAMLQSDKVFIFYRCIGDFKTLNFMKVEDGTRFSFLSDKTLKIECTNQNQVYYSFTYNNAEQKWNMYDCNSAVTFVGGVQQPVKIEGVQAVLHKFASMECSGDLPIANTNDLVWEFVFDDDEKPTEPTEPTPNDNIFSWLKDFFKNLGDFFVKLFVPPDDYFKNFFNEIKTAFEKKFSFFTDLGNALKQVFGNTNGKTGSITWTIPDNYLFSGFNGFTVDILSAKNPLLLFLRPILTGIVLLVTIIIIYKKLITFLHR